MKKILLSIILGAVSMPAMAFDLCETVGQFANKVIVGKQLGIPKNAVIKDIDKKQAETLAQASNDQQKELITKMNTLFKNITIEAYKEPKYTNKEKNYYQATNFTSRIYFRCLDASKQ